jgi:alpha-galactosidase
MGAFAIRPFGAADMLEVGKLASFNEDRSHFGAWCIISSPLILGHDLRDTNVTARVWPIIANTEAIAINQAWAGHPGKLVRSWGGSPSRILAEGSDAEQSGSKADASESGASASDSVSESMQLWMKPLGDGVAAAFVLNVGCAANCTATINIAADLGLRSANVRVRDVWAHADLGLSSGPTFTTDSIAAHDSRFYRFLESDIIEKHSRRSS